MPLFTPTQTVTESFVLTDAQVKALPTTSFTLVPAQGANTIILPLISILRLNWVASYTNISANAQLKLGLNDNSAASLASLNEPDTTFAKVSKLLANGESTTAILTPKQRTGAAANGVDITRGTTGIADSEALNVALTLSIDNDGSGDLTGGDAGNSLGVYLQYVVFDIS